MKTRLTNQLDNGLLIPLIYIYIVVIINDMNNELATMILISN